MKKVLAWEGTGLLGAAAAILSQLMTDATHKKDVEEYIEEHKDELFGDDDNATEQEGE